MQHVIIRITHTQYGIRDMQYAIISVQHAIIRMQCVILHLSIHHMRIVRVMHVHLDDNIPH